MQGLTASYLGVAETVLQFTLYENLKVWAGPRREGATGHVSSFGLGAASKLIASVLTYPHEVVRTRLREHGHKRCVGFPRIHSDVFVLHSQVCVCVCVCADKPCARYVNVVQTFKLILKEEGFAGLYGGLFVHLMRTVPNAAIMFMIVEALTDVGV